jgi:hypothetical protein
VCERITLIYMSGWICDYLKQLTKILRAGHTESDAMESSGDPVDGTSLVPIQISIGCFNNLSIVIQYFYGMGRYMKRILACCGLLAFLAASLSCGTSAFSIQDRWEGWGDDRVRIYILVNQDYPADGPLDSGKDTGKNTDKDEETPDDPAYVRLASERAAHLAGQYNAAAAYGVANEKANRDIDPGSGRVVYKKCDDAKCEAFVDFSYAGRGQ